MDPQNPFNTPGNHEADHEDSQEVIAERAIADAGNSQAMYNYNQKLLEQKERELMESIAMNYGRIRDVERELGNLQLQLKLTSGPKKHALEMLRKKIETQNEKVAYVRAKHTTAKATYERLDAELQQEEAAKDRLCGELNMLVQQAAKAQMDKLEELKVTLEGLYSGVMPSHSGAQQQRPQQPQQPQGPAPGGEAGPSGAAAAGTATQQQQAQAEAGPSGSAAAASQAAAADTPGEAAAEQQQEQLRRRQQEQERQEQERRAAEERRRREVEAAAARSRHVSLGSASGSPGGAAAAGARPSGASAAARSKASNGGTAAPAVAAPAGSAQKQQRFSGFDT